MCNSKVPFLTIDLFSNLHPFFFLFLQVVPFTCCVMENDRPVDLDQCYAAANNPDMPNAASYLHLRVRYIVVRLLCNQVTL